MNVVQAQAAALVAKAPLSLRDTHGCHSQIQKLVDVDEQRVKKQRASAFPSSWDGPIFDKRFEQRRLRLLNALFTCLTRCGMYPHISDKYGRDLSITVGTTSVPLTLDSMAAAKQIAREREGYAFLVRGSKDKDAARHRASLVEREAGPAWEDQTCRPLEKCLREIAAAIVVFAEQAVRDVALSAHAWRVSRKAELEEADRKRQPMVARAGGMGGSGPQTA
jgi:hypothetical protein